MKEVPSPLLNAEEGPHFMGIPDRWFEPPGPKYRCGNGHVSKCILRCDGRGDRCIACYANVRMTFPEDQDDA